MATLFSAPTSLALSADESVPRTSHGQSTVGVLAIMQKGWHTPGLS
jgi:hypothetical protein